MSWIRNTIKWQERKRSRLEIDILRVLFPILFILFVVSPSYLLYRRINIPLGLEVPFNYIIGGILLAVGTGLYAWTIILFSRAGGTQVPMVPTQKLVIKGPYAYCRNPMVTSGILMASGFGAIVNSLSFILIALIAPSVYFVYIKLLEEKELEARFGQEYIAYKKNTPFLIPKLRRK